MTQPFFSVIVPVYKAENYLRQCVESISEQTFADFELILVDDGSPDRSGAICDEYAAKDSRVKVIHKENGGNVSARRAGHALCTGKYIVHIDSDDYVDTDLLAVAAEKITTHGVDAVLFGFVRFDEHNSDSILQSLPDGLYRDMDVIRANLIRGKDGKTALFNSLWSMIVRRDIFLPCLDAVPTTLYKGEDLAATAPALAACNGVYILDRCCYHYRNTSDSITNAVKGDEVEQAMLVAEYLLEKMGPEYKQRLDNYVLMLLYDYLKRVALTRDRKGYTEAVKIVLDDRLCKHLKGARCDKNSHFTNKVLFFLLGKQWFGLFRLMVKIRN